LFAPRFQECAAPVVLTVKVDVPAPLLTAVGIMQPGSGVPPLTLTTEQVKLTVPVYPFTAVIVMVEVVDPPWVTAPSAVPAMVKFGPFTVRVSGAECTSAPEVPVTVTV
jgi:hypothetical protein